jgi:hypothetical protein
MDESPSRVPPGAAGCKRAFDTKIVTNISLFA